MFKLYEGRATPGISFTRFSIDWYCPHCHSPNVGRDSQDVRELHWCDGGPETEDDLRFWVCADCGERSDGRDMLINYQKLPLTPEEEREEQIMLEVQRQQYVERMARFSAIKTDPKAGGA